MNMGGVAGFGAMPGGMMDGMQGMQQIEQQKLQLIDTKAKQIGMEAYFRALQGMTGGQPGGAPQASPQPPMPGQPSQPMQQPGQQPQAMPGPQMNVPQVIGPRGPATPNAQGVYGRDAVMLDTPQQPAPVMAQGGAPQAPGAPQGGQPSMTWQGIAQAVKQQNPGVSDLALAHAIDKFMPMMTQQAQRDWQMARLEMQGELAQLRHQGSMDRAEMRADIARLQESGRNERTDKVEGGRNDRAAQTNDRMAANRDQRDEHFNRRESRLEKALKLREDTTWARLEQNKAALEERIRRGDRTAAVTEYRALLDAQHKRANEMLQASSINNTMKKDERAKFIKEQNDWYNGQIERLKGLQSQRGNLSDDQNFGVVSREDKPVPSRKPTASAAPPVDAAPSGAQPLPDAFKGDADGTKYQKDGKTYTKRGNQLILDDSGDATDFSSAGRRQPVEPLEVDPRQQGGPRSGLVIKDAAHLQKLIRNAEGDADLRKIQRALRRQGMDDSMLGLD